MTGKQFRNLFASHAWMMFPKKMLRKIGPEKSAVLCYMIDKANYYDTLTIFFDNQDTAADVMGLGSRKVFKRITDELENLGLISKQLKGVPAKVHYEINVDAILSMFDDQPETQMGQLDVTSRVNLDVTSRDNSCPESLHLLNNNSIVDNSTNKVKEDKSSSTNVWKAFDEYIGGPFFQKYPKRGRRDLMFKSLDTMKKERSDLDTFEKIDEYLTQFKQGLKIYLDSQKDPKFVMAPQNFISSRQWEQNSKPSDPSGITINPMSADDFLKSIENL
jgi:hypothetical protein